MKVVPIEGKEHALSTEVHFQSMLTPPRYDVRIPSPPLARDEYFAMIKLFRVLIVRLHEILVTHVIVLLTLSAPAFASLTACVPMFANPSPSEQSRSPNPITTERKGRLFHGKILVDEKATNRRRSVAIVFTVRSYTSARSPSHFPPLYEITPKQKLFCEGCGTAGT